MKAYINGREREMTQEETDVLKKEKEAYLSSSEFKIQEIQALKNELSTFDYIGVKIAMGVATKEDYADEIARTEQLRKNIRKLEKLIESEE
ncbi:hypothetical protein [Eubacterium sp.]